MGDVAGRDMELDISSNGGSTWTSIGGAKDFSLSHSGDTIDVTDFDSGYWREFITGLKTATGSFTMNYDEADSGQDLVRTQNESNVTYKYRIRPRGDTTGYREILWDAIITSMSDPSSSVEGVAETAVDLQFTGTPTIQNQS